MPVQVLQFRPRFSRPSGWSQPELAEFYRVESALLQAGVRLETEIGVSDEGDPWFAFCRQDTGEVFVHFARIDGEYLIDGASMGHVARHHDFKALVRELIASELITMARPKPRGSNVFMHPAALLIALVGAAFFHSGKADAAEVSDHKGPRRAGGSLIILGSGSSEKLGAGLDPVQTATILSGVIIGLDQQQRLPQLAALAAPPPAGAIAIGMDLSLFRVSSATALQPSQSSPRNNWQELQQSETVALAAMTHQEASAIPVASPETASPVVIAVTASAQIELQAALPAAQVTVAPAGQRPFFLDLSTPTSLPSDEAGAVVQAVFGRSDPLVALGGKLPTTLVDLINHGSHLPPETPAPVVIPTSVTPPEAVTPPEVVTPPQTVVSTPAPAADGPPATPTPAPATQPGSPSTTPASPAPTDHQTTSDAAISAAVSAFMNEAVHWQLVVDGRNLVIYDTAIFGHLPASTTLDSLTFTLSDGSTVSLVGTAAEIHYLYTLH